MRASLIPRILLAGMAGVSDAGAAPVVMRMGGGVLVVSLDDALDQVMANDVALVEIIERNTLDLADDFDRFDEAGAARFGQINLGDVACDHRFGIEAQSR